MAPKVLIIRLSSIGDIVLTTPVVRCLKKHRPQLEIHYLTKKSYAPLLEANPYIQKLHLLHQSIEECIEALNQENFDYIIDLHHNLRTLRIKRALRVPAVAFHKLNFEKWLLTALKINRLPKVHIVERNMQTLHKWQIEYDGRGLDYFTPKNISLKPQDIPMSHQAGYVGLVIGAALATKQMPVEKLAQLCQQIAHPIILLGGPEDRQAGETISLTDPVKIYNACGKFSLHESALLVKQAKLIITHDTGLMHIAAAYQKPIISIWGNTVPDFGMGPWYTQPAPYNAIFEVANLRCRPCSKIGHKKCPKGHFKCMMLQ
ncbi:MAG TPA: glycosyltransferase family 9 protein, partial [Phnomibacter sp.]|nr:glycosyltransferase family 9 protein [Phnomibacter sp.]